MGRQRRGGGRRATSTSSVRHVRLRVAQSPKLGRYVVAILTQTAFVRWLLLLVSLWMLFAMGLYFAEHDAEGTSITSLGDALYWGIAAFSTAGIADTPVSGVSKAIGGTWIVLGSVIFFGIIVATVTSYFFRPVQRPVHQIVDTIEYNLEHLEDLSVEELDLLKATIDSLIVHVEKLKQREQAGDHDAAAGR